MQSAEGVAIGRARNGSPYAVVGTRHIHSSFNPEQECARFLDAQQGQRFGSTVIVVGASLGYVTAELRRRYPRVRVVTLDFTAAFRDHRVALPDFEWDVGAREPLRSFLYRAIAEEDLAGMVVLEWPPAVQVFADQAANVAPVLREVLAELNATIATTGYFGKRWFRNAVANFLNWESFTSIPDERAVTVIAASGPSLERSAAVIAEQRERVRVWALSSAVRPLLARGIIPDLVVSTDAGFYAMEHLWPLAEHPVPVALALTSARGSWNIGFPVIPLHQGSPIEDALLPYLPDGAVTAPPNGTVAGTALELGFACTTVPLAFAGFDLGFPDLKSHAAPHAFDRYVRYRADRTAPETTLLFERNVLASKRAGDRQRTTRAQDTFARWFASRIAGSRRPVYRLLSAQSSLPMLPLDPDGFRRLARGTTVRSFSSTARPRIGNTLRRDQRAGVVTAVMAEWRELFRGMPSRLSSLGDAESPLWRTVRFLDMRGLLRIRRESGTDADRSRAEAVTVSEELIAFLAEMEERLRKGFER